MNVVSITLSVPDELKDEMEEFGDIYWSAVARMAIIKRLQMLKDFREFTKDSTFTQDDAIRLGRIVNAAVHKRHVEARRAEAHRRR